MNLFFDAVRVQPFFAELQTALKSGQLPASVTGLSGIHKAQTVMSLGETTKVLVICDSEANATRLVSDINEMSGRDMACLYPVKDFTFAPADDDTFLCLKAAKEAISKGGLYPCAVNGANERAVELFLQDKISFLDIGKAVYGVLSQFDFEDEYTLEDVFEADKKAREYVDSIFNL